ncbi:molybdopterin-dependent oxidoreductase [Salinithrix halophila]|uniref:Molybdopterin-dependent oxidoreductase n=1 Tax=Salinithrix halophila TaxID=1485204 RepID=A0ABV8JAE1_9BACL
MGNWRVKVVGAVESPYELTEEIANRMNDGSVRPEERVPGVDGKAVSLKAVLGYAVLTRGATHVRFIAADEFQADIPLKELEQAFFLYQRQEGRPLERGGPLRLYVPDGSSNCLNVKSVTEVQVVAREKEDADRSASFGFRQTLSPDTLRLKHR